jgi:hypothetical protein
MGSWPCWTNCQQYLSVYETPPAQTSSKSIPITTHLMCRVCQLAITMDYSRCPGGREPFDAGALFAHNGKIGVYSQYFLIVFWVFADDLAGSIVSLWKQTQPYKALVCFNWYGTILSNDIPVGIKCAKRSLDRSRRRSIKPPEQPNKAL